MASRAASACRSSLRAIPLLASLSLLLAIAGCDHAGAQRNKPGDGSDNVTDIAIGPAVQQSSVKRLGINLSGQSYYDSGQMLRNLSFRNPGFEAETWRSILRCKAVTATSCTDGNEWTSWPIDFLKGAQFEFISGVAKGLTGTIQTSTSSAGGGLGITFTFAKPDRAPAKDDFVIVQRAIPGNPLAGWWGDAQQNGSTFTAEASDLSPHTPGKQALRITAAGPGQSASLHSYFDSYSGKSFVQLSGPYELAFRAKGVGGKDQVAVSVTRIGTSIGNVSLFAERTIRLSPEWKDYAYAFTAAENGGLTGPVDLNFRVAGGNVLLDDVSLTAGASSKNATGVSSINPTAFRNEVVSTLRTLHPGVLRYMDSGTNFGSSLDNMIAVPFARMPAGFSTQENYHEDIPLGLHEFLQLCQAIGAEPWYTMQAGMSPVEARNLIEYLAASPSTIYGSKRAALGQATPWTTIFPVIHLELGNEQWNGSTFYGAAINEPVAYGRRAEEIFAAARSSSAYIPDKFDLILGSQAVNPWWTQEELNHSSNYDSAAVAPYLFTEFNDTSSNESIFGPMFAQPEMIDSVASGYMAQQAKTVKSATHPAKLAVYEVNLGTMSGAAQQPSIDAVVTSIAAGITVAEHMLLMMRDLGITNQAIWALPQYANHFRNPADPKEKMWLWGTVIDMGGSTNRRRPQFLAEQLANQAILPTMLTTTLTGANPTWNQKPSANDGIKLDKAHYLQTFAFVDGRQHSLIVFNLSRDEALPITFSGAAAPSGTVNISQLTSKNITDTNEAMANVGIVDWTLNSFNPRSPYSVPRFSMTVFRWTATN